MDKYFCDYKFFKMSNDSEEFCKFRDHSGLCVKENNKYIWKINRMKTDKDIYVPVCFEFTSGERSLYAILADTYCKENIDNYGEWYNERDDL